ncbi:MAG: sensor histidine kinase [Lachnospiraceae bacterium]|nr:sensor histidine kinase [Lachnospiraceae bacterium]
MKRKRKPSSPVTLDRRMRTLLITFFVPVLVMMCILFVALITYVNQYTSILHNVTTASEFNQDFKENIDLKMYYYVVGSHYSDGLPIEEVESAQELARGLLETTTQDESWKAINGVLELCENLEEKIYLIEATDNYDDRQTQLENNIYVLTELIQEYMYNYLYHEASLLDSLQSEMVRNLWMELVLILAAVLALLIIMLRRSLRFAHSITRPISALCARVQSIGEGDLAVRTPIQAQEYEIQTLSNGFEDMVGRLNRQIEQNRQEQMRLRSAELALLQAQINPHFLYNTLDAIVWLIEMEKNEQAVEMVTSLSSFFRSSLSNGRDVITLREEEQHVRSYLEIQHMRYKDILEYEINIAPELAPYRIPKLTLQPLVENALYHGIKLKRGRGHIRVAGQMEAVDSRGLLVSDPKQMEEARQKNPSAAVIVLTVEDDGAGMEPERLAQVRSTLKHEQSIGFGVATVHERLQLMFGPEYGLQIESRPGEGTCVTARIPPQEIQTEQNPRIEKDAELQEGKRCW